MAVLYKREVEMSDFTVPFVKNRFEKGVSVAVVWVGDDSWCWVVIVIVIIVVLARNALIIPCNAKCFRSLVAYMTAKLLACMASYQDAVSSFAVVASEDNVLRVVLALLLL